MKIGEILVIDLFAGPGGLGEGISFCRHKNGNYPFKIGVSVEKESSAHKTLTTRAFYRKIKDNPTSLKDYFLYLEGEISRQELFQRYPTEASKALNETLEKPRALGEDNILIHERIRELTEKHKGPKVVIGGPPCQAYSLAGRTRNAGIKDYRAENDHRNFLYKEYLEVLSIAQPDVFVMENVRGILSAKVNGELIFPKILDDLREPGKITNRLGVKGYKIYSLVKEDRNLINLNYTDFDDFIIKSEQYGIPQARHRVILLGVRDDIKQVPQILTPVEKMVTVEQVLSDLPPLRSGFSKRKDDEREWRNIVEANVQKVQEYLEDVFGWNAVSTLEIKPFKGLKRSEKEKTTNLSSNIPEYLQEWYLKNEPRIVLNHETRGHMEGDLVRYAFSSAYTYLNNGVSPKSRDFPKNLAPAHENWNTGTHTDRFRTQAANKCATTVTSHISKDGHYFIHYDPRQCRSLTVREAARLQTFPDNYVFEGNRTQQYVQVGNAVPPYLARQIGEIVLNLLE
ncbi:DNA cytosine methyltransferase [Xenorhabdus bovienii]|uniref:DNA cytosine methyltransferase n=1 Tax=Xenorhabdus bovienii TaxID=40576 RepID=UPI00237CAD35|nr:DNA cytosine methyltransferase [Xenorhabdus bovienii]MDE1476007.1 DNA cytosine methyltransferase [Xenorhabdus bovienii]MDE9427729.1 DNA cytosine methyltransferase [Xenorhabdus bovienii]